jgi:SAM-dependent methyltransferase
MILYLLIALFILYCCFCYFKKEGFEDTTKEFKTYLNENIYNDFYTKIYDNVIHTIPYETEIIKIIHTYFGSNPNVLITGSRTGHMVQLLREMCEVTGLDNSQSMVKFSKNKYPDNQYIYGNYTNKSIFQKNKFTHIICPLFTIYRVDLDDYLDTMYDWLVHKGYLAIVYYKEDFTISQLQNLNPSKSFTIKYKYTIELNNNILKETITTEQGSKRINKLELNDISNLEEISKFTGFKKINVVDVPNTNNICMLILQKT